MSKKNLLSESTIRKFMKFANIDALADGFLKEGSYVEEGEPDPMEEMSYPMEEEEDMGAPEDDMDMDMDAPEDDMDMDMDAPEDDMDMEPEGDSELPPEAVTALEQAVEAAVDSLLDALAPYGVRGDVEVEDETELPGDEGPVDSAVPMDDEAEDDMGDEDLDTEVLDEEAIVNETLNRVTRRLREMSAQAKQAAEQDALVERIAEAVTRRLRK